MATEKLNTQEIFAGIKKEFWNDLATNIRLMIEKDMIDGQVQEYTSQTRMTSGGAKNYSKGYKKTKEAYGKRRTKGAPLYTSIKGKKDLYFKNKKVKLGTGKLLKAGQTFIDNTTTSVNMRATGKTILGLHREQILSNGVILSYQEADRKKIEYNAAMGRIITTLNEKNREKVLNLYSDALDVSLRKWAQKELVIRVGN